MRTLVFALVLAAAPALASAAIVVEQPELRASLGGNPNSAAYMVLRNTGKAADRLVGADCACAAMTMIHQTTQVGTMSHMDMQASVELPPGGVVRFAPNGRHLMLTGIAAPIRAGVRVPIVLRFAKAPPATIQFIATDTPGMGPTPGKPHTH